MNKGVNIGIAGVWLSLGLGAGGPAAAQTNPPALEQNMPEAWPSWSAAETNFTPLAANALPQDTNATVITSTRMSFDQQQRVALFEERVVVTNPEIQIRADRLKVLFSEENKVQSIVAEGQVVISQKDIKATGSRATYSVEEGKVVLIGKPLIQRGQDLLAGDTITFWRNTNRILCEPNARVIIHAGPDIRAAALTGP